MQKEPQVDASDAKARYLIEHYQPQFLGEGGNHIVFSSPKHSSVVVKVDKGLLKKTEDYLAQHHIDAPDAELLQHAKTFMDQYRSRVDKLKIFFPPLSILGERLFFTQVPVPTQKQKDGMRTLKEKMGWGIVRVQDRIPTDADQIVSLDSPYPERRKVDQRDPERYWKTTKALLKGEDCDLADSSWIQPRLERYIARAKNDEVFRSALVDFIERAITYTEKTGQLLDLVGGENLVFLQNASQRSWRFLLVDVLPTRAQTVSEVIAALDRFKRGERVNPEIYSQLLNGLHWVRCINGLASGLHIPHRIHALESLVRLSEEQRAALYTFLHPT